MNYKETLFFIAKCLTINQEKHNLEIVKNLIESQTIDWDSVVKISTSHYAFPALYCNLKKAKLLDFLPQELVEFMKHITDLNRKRNQEIIKQVHELNDFLLKNNITPIFLKGVGNIFQDFYDDIGERMLADIDFIVSKNEYQKTIDLVKSFGYQKVEKFKHHSPSFKHYPRLQKKGHVATVEIHKEILLEKFANEFNYETVKTNCIKANGITILNYEDQLSLAILANQINDDGFYYKNLTLKPAYDVYLLSKKTNPQKAFQKFKKLKYPLNCFLASSYQVFNEIDSLIYKTNSKTERYLKYFNSYLTNEKKRERKYRLKKIKLYLIRKKDLILKTIYHKEYRNWFIDDLLIRLKLKKLSA